MLREELKGDTCVSALVTYMEKMTLALRKLKRWSCRRKKRDHFIGSSSKTQGVSIRSLMRFVKVIRSLSVQCTR